MLTKRLQRWAWTFLAPALIVYTVFWVFALLAGLSLGTTKWTGYGPMTFVGLDNLKAILGDGHFWESLGRNVRYGILNTIFGLGLGLFTALLLDRIQTWRVFFRTAIYLPVVLSWVIVMFLFRWLFNPSFGLLNPLLRAVGLGFLATDWLVNYNALFYLICAISIWKTYPVSTITFYAALQNMPKEMKEAAYIDGADELACTWHVILPQLKPVVAVLVSLSLMDAFRVFDPFYVLGGSGGGIGTLGLDVIAALLFRRAFSQAMLGNASALGFILFILTLAVSLLYLRTLGRSED